MYLMAYYPIFMENIKNSKIKINKNYNLKVDSKTDTTKKYLGGLLDCTHVLKLIPRQSCRSNDSMTVETEEQEHCCARSPGNVNPGATKKY